jgi:hypothetical protein
MSSMWKRAGICSRSNPRPSADVQWAIVLSPQHVWRIAMTRPENLFEAASYDLNKFRERRLAERRTVPRDSVDRRIARPVELGPHDLRSPDSATRSAED